MLLDQGGGDHGGLLLADQVAVAAVLVGAKADACSAEQRELWQRWAQGPSVYPPKAAVALAGRGLQLDNRLLDVPFGSGTFVPLLSPKQQHVTTRIVPVQLGGGSAEQEEQQLLPAVTAAAMDDLPIVRLAPATASSSLSAVSAGGKGPSHDVSNSSGSVYRSGSAAASTTAAATATATSAAVAAATRGVVSRYEAESVDVVSVGWLFQGAAWTFDRAALDGLMAALCALMAPSGPVLRAKGLFRTGTNTWLVPGWRTTSGGSAEHPVNASSRSAEDLYCSASSDGTSSGSGGPRPDTTSAASGRNSACMSPSTASGADIILGAQTELPSPTYGGIFWREVAGGSWADSRLEILLSRRAARSKTQQQQKQQAHAAHQAAGTVVGGPDNTLAIAAMMLQNQDNPGSSKAAAAGAEPAGAASAGCTSGGSLADQPEVPAMACAVPGSAALEDTLKRAISTALLQPLPGKQPDWGQLQQCIFEQLLASGK